MEEPKYLLPFKVRRLPPGKIRTLAPGLKPGEMICWTLQDAKREIDHETIDGNQRKDARMSTESK